MHMRNPEQPQKLPLDTLGILLLAIGLGALQYVLDQGQEKDWFGDPLIRWLAIISGVLLTGFMIWELFLAASPAVDLRVLRFRSVAAGSALGFTLGITLLGTLITLPQFVQGSLHFTATLAGQLLVLRALPVMIFTPLGARLAASGKVDPRLQIGGGFILIGISNLLLTTITTPQTNFWGFAASLIMSGIGLSQVFVPLSLTIFANLSPRDIPKAAAFFNLSRQLGGSIATAVLLTLLVRFQVDHQSALAGNANLSRPVVSDYVQTSNGQVSRDQRISLEQSISGQALVQAYADVSLLVGILTLCLAPLALLLEKPKPKPSAPGA